MADELIVFAPGSMLVVQEAILEAFRSVAPDVPVHFHPPDHSGRLARQILDGSAADVFISANQRYLDDVHQAGLAPAPRVLAGNRLALAVRPRLNPPVQQLADLVRPGLRLLIPPAESDPLGQYTVELFERSNLTAEIAEKRQRAEIREEVATPRGWLDESEFDAAVIYATVAPMFGDSIEVVALPAELDLHDRIVFAIGAISRGGATHPAANRFVEFLLGEEGQALLRRAGFTLPPDPRAERPAG